tara:strand:- start:606 stop:884 length:279 start_codon:yes stop_codon:yes gene_type:complete
MYKKSVFLIKNYVFLTMNVERLNIYERLRDFKVPSSVLDSIFSNENDAMTLIDAFKALVNDGFKDDQAAEKISEMIFKELNIDPDQSILEEK